MRHACIYGMRHACIYGLWPYLRFDPLQIETSSEAFGVHPSDSCLCFIREVAEKNSLKTEFGDNSWLTLVWESWNGKRNDNKEVSLLIKYLTVPDKNNLIVNINFTKIKVTVRIDLKRPNLNYPSSCLVGRHLTFPVTTTRYIPWVELLLPTLRIGRL
jgi:hypothetical protein